MIQSVKFAPILGPTIGGAAISVFSSMRDPERALEDASRAGLVVALAGTAVAFASPTAGFAIMGAAAGLISGAVAARAAHALLGGDPHPKRVVTPEQHKAPLLIDPVDLLRPYA